MASHHFLGRGLISSALAALAAEPDRLVATVSELVRASGLEVVADDAVAFEGQGLTVVWVLAESHLVLHLWAEEGYATIDLHVCDFHGSNAARGEALAERLRALCFAPGTDRWRRLELEPPRRPAGAAAPHSSQ